VICLAREPNPRGPAGAVSLPPTSRRALLAGSDDAAYELVRQHNRYHQSDDPTCPYCAFERSARRTLAPASTKCPYYEI